MADLVLPPIWNKPGMIVVRRPNRLRFVSVAEFGAHLAEEPAAKASAQDIAHHFERRIILVSQLAAELAQHKIGLCHVGFYRQEYARVARIIDWRKRRHGIALDGPIGEEFFQFSVHLRRLRNRLRSR